MNTNDKVVRSSEIKIKVGLDKENVPVELKWKAEDSQHNELKDCKSINVSLWDPYMKDTLSIDLWTNEMRVDEMHKHYVKTLINLTESYHRATGNPFIKKDIEAFCSNLIDHIEEWEKQKTGSK